MVVLWDCIVPARLSSASLPGVPTITSGLFALIAPACSQFPSHYMQESHNHGCNMSFGASRHVWDGSPR